MFAARASLIIAICLNVLSGLLLGFSASSSVALTAPFDGQVRVQVFSTVEKPAGFGEVSIIGEISCARGQTDHFWL